MMTLTNLSSHILYYNKTPSFNSVTDLVWQIHSFKKCTFKVIMYHATHDDVIKHILHRYVATMEDVTCMYIVHVYQF